METNKLRELGFRLERVQNCMGTKVFSFTDGGLFKIEHFENKHRQGWILGQGEYVLAIKDSLEGILAALPKIH